MSETPNPRRRARTPILVVVLALGLSGCTKEEAPMRATDTHYARDTLVEQLVWVEAQLDAAITASEITEGWVAPFGEFAVPWDASPQHRVDVLGSLLPQGCGLGGQLMQDLVVSDAPDPFGAAARVRAAWEAGGWSVSDVYGSAEPSMEYFRADREDGAVMSLDADDTGIILRVRSPCSAHRSVTNPTEDLSERDAFLEEIRTRESS